MPGVYGGLDGGHVQRTKIWPREWGNWLAGNGERIVTRCRVEAAANAAEFPKGANHEPGADQQDSEEQLLQRLEGTACFATSESQLRGFGLLEKLRDIRFRKPQAGRRPAIAQRNRARKAVKAKGA